MKISELPNCPQWLKDADTVDADVEWSLYGTLLWNRGEFRGGEFLGDKITSNPLSVYGLRWPVVISPFKMQIGCERHSHSEWAALNDAAINKMDRGALKFWREHRDTLLVLCKSRALLSGEGKEG